jgi:uncharacterized protein
MEKKIVYFEKPGWENTVSCLEIVMQSLSENSSKHLVVASTTGETGILFSQAFQGKGINIVVVTHSSGFKEPNSIEMPSEDEKGNRGERGQGVHGFHAHPFFGNSLLDKI